jgi:hypothetical protein
MEDFMEELFSNWINGVNAKQLKEMRMKEKEVKYRKLTLIAVFAGVIVSIVALAVTLYIHFKG